MSTKTTIKRIALVAVAALGFGMVTTVNSNATAAFTTLYHGSANYDCNVASGFACTTQAKDASFVAINKGADYGFQTTFLAGAAADQVKATWTLVSAPTGFLTPLISVTPWKAADEYGPDYSDAAAGGGGGIGGWFLAGTANATTGAAVANGVPTKSGLETITTATAAGSTVGNFKNTFTPTVAGTYVWNLTAGTTVYTWTVNAYATQAAADAALLAYRGISTTVSAATSTALLGAGDAIPGADATVATPMALQVAARATIKVTLKNAAGADVSAYNPITATISGPGYVAVGAAVGQAATGKSVTGANGAMIVQVFSDSTAGKGVVTISSGTTTIATKTVTFYGSAAKIVATVVKPVVATVGANAGVVTGVVTDSLGNAVANQAVKVVSSNAAAFSDSYTACAAVSAADGSVTCPVTGVAAGTANITLTTNASAADTTGVTSNAVEVRFGSAAIASYSLTMDSSSYVPGQQATLTLTPLDASGLTVAVGTALLGTSTVTANYALTVNGFDKTATVPASGSITFKVNMPLAAAEDLAITFSDGAALSASAKASVSGGSASDALDAATEATDAANAATDAANAAAEAADAATAAAQDAQAAVQELATQVAALIAEIKDQITALTNLVIKIQKKVKA